MIDVSQGEFPGGLLRLVANDNGQQKTVISGLSLDRPSMRFLEVPAGAYKAEVTLADERKGQSSWVNVQHQGENTIVVLMAN